MEPRVTRSFLAVLALLALSGAFSAPVYADPKSCSVLFEEDAVLRAALPERVRTLLESGRGKLLFTNREAEWEPFFRKLDQGRKKPGVPFRAKLATLTAELEFLSNAESELRLQVNSVTRRASAEDFSLDLIELIAAQTAWVAKKRSEKPIRAVEVSTLDLRQAPASELLESLGFSRRKDLYLHCAKIAAVGGLAGYGAGYLVFVVDESGVEGGAPEDQRRSFLKKTVGSGVVFALGVGTACIDRERRSYRLRMELPEKP
jgi:hypothetical protein